MSHRFQSRFAEPSSGCCAQAAGHILEAFGAEISLTPAKEGTDGAIIRSHKTVDKDPDMYYMPNQFENENNILAHYETTGPEIFAQTNGNLDVFVTGMGTTGTLMGVGKYLKEKKPSVRIVGIEPIEGHTIQGLKNMKESIVPKIYNRDIIDEIIMDNDSKYDHLKDLLVKDPYTPGNVLMGLATH